MNPEDPSAGILLAVDLGLRTGFSVWRSDGRLLAVRSHHYANKAALKRAAWATLRDTADLTHLLVEGDGQLGDAWTKAATKQGVAVRMVSAEQWRRDLLWAREQRSGSTAKSAAMGLAVGVMESAGGWRPTSLTHDAAEAVLLGLWGATELGWVAPGTYLER